MVNDDRTLKTYFVDSASSIIYIGQTFGGITESKSNVTGLAFSPETAFVLTSPNGWKFLVYVTDLGEIRTSRVCFESSTPSAIPPQPFVFLADQNLSEQAINDIFTELPLATPDPTQEWSEWALDISNNPGTATSDFTIATDKGWQVYPPLYRLTSNVAQTNEGTSVTFTLRTSILTATIPYTITGITTNDIGGTALNGNFDVVNGLATKTFNIAADQLTEGVETMTLTLAVDSQVPVSQSVQINDTSLTPQGCYTPGQNWVVDGRNLQVCNSITVANISLLNGAALWVPAGVTLTITGVVNSSPNSTIFASGTIAGNVNFGILSPGDPNGGVWPCAQQC
jgi:hypothetical protein